MQIVQDYCHKVAMELESRAQENDSMDEEWIEMGSILKFTDLESLVDLATEKHSAPFLTEVLKRRVDGVRIPTHTTVILGKDLTQDRYIAWEKSGLSMAFQLVTLEDIYNSYSNNREWRIRPLKT